MTTIINFINTHKKQTACVMIIAILACVGIYFYLQHIKTAQEAAQVIKYADTTDQDKIKKDLAVDGTTAAQIVKEIQYIHDGSTPPTVTYYVQSPTIEKAAEETATAIEKKDPDLPVAAVAKSDRTVVTPNPVKQKVDVYKINLKDNHKIKAGMMSADGKPYFGIGYQAGRVEGMLYTRTGRTVDAASLTYTIKQW